MEAAGTRGHWEKSKGTGVKKWLAIIGPLLLVSLHRPLKKTNRSLHSNNEPKPVLWSLVGSTPSSPAKVRGLRARPGFVTQKSGALALHNVQGHLENPSNYSGNPNILALWFSTVSYTPKT